MEETTEIIVQPVDKSKVRHLLKVALILFIVTIFEFVIAFTMESSPLRTSIFIGLTIVKAFYIVSEFMHLGHEANFLGCIESRVLGPSIRSKFCFIIIACPINS